MVIMTRTNQIGSSGFVRIWPVFTQIGMDLRMRYNCGKTGNQVSKSYLEISDNTKKPPVITLASSGGF